VVPLTDVKKKDKAWKGKQIEEVRSLVDKYKNLFLISVDNLRTNKMQRIREDWKGSRLFFGKNKMTKVALGRTEAEEYKDGLSKLGSKLTGFRGLLFTDHSKQEVLKYFNSYSAPEFAQSGFIATQTVVLDAGPLEQFNFSMEKRLRELGLDILLKNGVMELQQELTVCQEGQAISTESARILEHLGIEMAEMKVTVEGVWTGDHGYTDLTDGSVKTKSKTKKKKEKKTSEAKQVKKSKRQAKIKDDVDDVAMEDESEEEMTEVN